MTQTFTVLGIESSCDDTAAAVVEWSAQRADILSSIVKGQNDLHSEFGGVVPEIAARAHVEKIDHCVLEAMFAADLRLSDIDLVAVTAGPGLIGGVLSGVMCAKGIAATTGKPLIGVNHLAGHALTPRLTDGISFPYLMLLVSGGHCQLLFVSGPTSFTRLGGTIDDAPGEAFDKSARILGLSQPGGPSIEKEAAAGDPRKFSFPRPLLDRPGCDMSFSGLKTAIIRARDRIIDAQGGIPKEARSDLCASFQAAVADVLTEKTRRALASTMKDLGENPVLSVAGGVASNASIRAKLELMCEEMEVKFVAPPLALCTDNAAMIAYAGAEQYHAGIRSDMSLAARPRWPLDTKSETLIGGGKKGAKA